MEWCNTCQGQPSVDYEDWLERQKWTKTGSTLKTKKPNSGEIDKGIPLHMPPPLEIHAEGLEEGDSWTSVSEEESTSLYYETQAVENQADGAKSHKDILGHSQMQNWEMESETKLLGSLEYDSDYFRDHGDQEPGYEKGYHKLKGSSKGTGGVNALESEPKEEPRDITIRIHPNRMESSKVNKSIGLNAQARDSEEDKVRWEIDPQGKPKIYNSDEELDIRKREKKVQKASRRGNWKEFF
ncbi:hypothetical protein ABW19_dt0202906 [Dactylella cylindrospora]|nr:hypothetical protein ABW19_dt0202906 [Dactylella cylindrospora]